MQNMRMTNKRSPHCVQYIVIKLLLFGIVGGLFTLPLSALERPRPGEIARLKQSGQFAQRQAFAQRLGNNRYNPQLVQRFVQKMRAQGYAPTQSQTSDSRQAPPPAWKNMPTTGSPKIFVLLIEFSDYEHSVTNDVSSITEKIFGSPDNDEYPYESLANYYSRASYGRLDLSDGVVLGWYNTGAPRSVVDETDAGREQLLMTALDSFDAATDFSQFDNDDDGEIDYFAVIWTGPDNGWANFWWGYQTSWQVNPTYTLDGKTLGAYSWQWESRPVGGAFSPSTLIHETGHALGLPDYYDYDESVGPGGGVGGLDMMDSNWGDHNCFSKWMLDWLIPAEMTFIGAGTQTVSLVPSAQTTGTEQKAVVIFPNTDSSKLFSEYFMVQNRQRMENDVKLPADGMLIWHVDATLNEEGTDFAYDNSYTTHKLLRLMEADGLEQIQNSTGVANAGDYYTAGKTFSDLTKPSSKTYAATNSTVSVGDIVAPGVLQTATFSVGLNCATATKITAGVSYKGTTVGGLKTTATYTCTDCPTEEIGPEKLHQVYIPTSGVFTATLSGVAATTDLDIFVLSASCLPATDTLAGGDLSASFNVTTPGIYYVAVDQKLKPLSTTAAGGAYTLTVEAPLGYDNWISWVDGRKVTAGEVAMTALTSPTPDRLHQAVKGSDGFVWTRFTDDGFSWYPWTTGATGSVLNKRAKAAGTVAMIEFSGTLYQAIRSLATTATATTLPFAANLVLTRTSEDGIAWSDWTASDQLGSPTASTSRYRVGSDVTMSVFDGKLHQAARSAASAAPLAKAVANAVLTRSFNGTTWSDWQYDATKKAASVITMTPYGGRLYQATTEVTTLKVLTRYYYDDAGTWTWSAWDFDAASTALKAVGNVAMAGFNGQLYQAIRQSGTNKIWTRSYNLNNGWTAWTIDPYGKIAAGDPKLFAFDNADRLYRTINSAGKVLTQYTMNGVNWTPWVTDGIAISPTPITMATYDPSDTKPRLYQATKGTLNTVWTRYTNADEVIMAPTPQPPATQSVLIRKSGTGTGIVTVGTWVCPLSCQELQIPVLPGVTLSASATPADGSTFVGWQTTSGEALTGFEYVQPGETVFAVFDRQ